MTSSNIAGTTTTYTYDTLGNYTKANGQSFAELTYDAWGMPESPNKLLNNDHGNYVFATFTGHIYDTILDIYFAEARFYDVNNRIWLAMDPIKDEGNWYQYCCSNPATYYEPTGQAGFFLLPDAWMQMIWQSYGRMYRFVQVLGLVTEVDQQGNCCYDRQHC